MDLEEGLMGERDEILRKAIRELDALKTKLIAKTHKMRAILEGEIPYPKTGKTMTIIEATDDLFPRWDETTKELAMIESAITLVGIQRR